LGTCSTRRVDGEFFPFGRPTRRRTCSPRARALVRSDACWTLHDAAQVAGQVPAEALARGCGHRVFPAVCSSR
jgi:hypothetical protein